MDDNHNHSSDIIKSLQEDTARYISAGEKISDIETAVRELIENSIDANSTKIEIRLRDFGVSLIEIEDDGMGIRETDFNNLASKYCTSKIINLDSLKTLTTFGFRGEALSCLCASADVTIVTKDKSAPTGTKMVFSQRGEIKIKTSSHRDRGTTVSVRDLFKVMPARRRDLERNAKKQYDKLVKLIYENILARPHIRFTICKLDGIRKEKDFVHGGTNLEACLIGIYGTKTMDTLIPFKQATSGQEETSNSVDNLKSSIAKFSYSTTASRTRSKTSVELPVFEISGYISKATHSCGRNSKDCQYVFVNRKPCELPKLNKTINEIYRNYNQSQYPFFALFINVQPWAVDFNVPKKRTIILNHDTALYEIVQRSLELMYHQPNIIKEQPSKQSTLNTSFVPASMLSNGKHMSDVQIQSTDPINHSRSSSRASELTDTETSKYHKAHNPYHDSEDDYLTPEASTPEVQDTPTTPMIIETNDVDVPEVSIVEPAPPTLPQSQDDITIDCSIPSQTKPQQVNNEKPISGATYSASIHPDFNLIAEEELKASLTKESFEKMIIVGQFNKGFIITKLDNHLFIIDQHASDERFNYEDQLSNLPIVKQPLVHPKPLFLNSMQEKLIEEHRQLFESKGFSFNIDMSKMPGTRVSLSTTSICKGTKQDVYLDKEDIEELIRVIMESPNQAATYTLSKVKALSASRACRKSVMIGSSLDHSQMKEIVTRMGSLKNPWICAHGRPTIRHLIDTNWLSKPRPAPSA